MTDDLTETTDMSNDEVTTDAVTTDALAADDTAPNPLDLLPTGDTDVLADAAEPDDESDTGSDVAEEVAAVHAESDETQAADEDAADGDAATRTLPTRTLRAPTTSPSKSSTTPRRAPASGTWSTPRAGTRRRSPPTCKRASSR